MTRPRKPKAACVNHADRPAHALSLCRRCYQAQRPIRAGKVRHQWSEVPLVPLGIRSTLEIRDRLDAAARAAGVSRSAWCVRVLDAAAPPLDVRAQIAADGPVQS